MPHRAHLTTVKLGSALRDALRAEGYSASTLRSDALAGLTVAVVAIPLAMALAVAAGVPPQYGLYSSIVAGLVAALAGGSRYSVSGPTAAFVVILAPITARYGMAGLATAGLMAGLILVALAVSKLGRLIEYVPEPVTVGFTSGIALVIALLQLNDLLGLGLTALPEHTLSKVALVAESLSRTSWPSVLVGMLTLAVIVAWPQRRLVIPGYAPAIIVGALAALALSRTGHPVDTIGSRFVYEMGGTVLHGVPRTLPVPTWPWSLPGAGGGALHLDLATLRDLLPSAVSIAMLGAIESLLCAVVLDRQSGTRHHSNGELLGQGLANIVAPFFGGVPSTAALARSAANITAGATTPLAAAFHSAFVFAGVLLLAPALGFVPMSSMAAILLVVAWKMSDAPTAVTLMRRSSRAERLVLITCFGLTVAFDMVVAITVGIVLAALLFMRDIARFTQVRDVTADARYTGGVVLPGDWRIVKITGAMFFAAAERVLSQLLAESPDGEHIVIYGDGITLLDSGGVGAFERFAEECDERRIHVVLTDLQPQPARAARAAGLGTDTPALDLAPNLDAALERARAS